MNTKSKFVVAIVAVLVVGSFAPAIGAAEDAEVFVNGPDTAEPGEEVTFGAELTNTGENASAHALEHTVPGGWTVVGFTENDGTYSEPKNEWLFRTIQPGDTVVEQVTFKIPEDAQPGEYTVSVDGKDGDGVADSDSATITVVEPTATATPTATDEPDEDTPTATPTATDTPETPTATDTPTDTPETPTETPPEDEGISPFILVLIVLIIIAVAAGLAYYFLAVQGEEGGS